MPGRRACACVQKVRLTRPIMTIERPTPADTTHSSSRGVACPTTPLAGMTLPPISGSYKSLITMCFFATRSQSSLLH
jgi:hypothetical protein